jgi:putative membrane protein
MINFVKTIQDNPQHVSTFLKVFYIVGLIGIFLTPTSAFFVSLTPLAIILSFGLLLFFHPRFDFNTISTFFLIAVLGFFIEERGVNTGLIFGHYSYGDTLGLKISNTPIIIGLNWLLMTYITASVVDLFDIRVAYKIIAAAVLMVIYDLVLEQVAPLMNMWSWQNSTIPLQNYLAWFVISLVFQLIFKIRKIDTYNPIAASVLIIQFVFFITLFLFL